MKLSKKIIKKIEEMDFSVEQECDGVYLFRRYSPAGQDFNFTINTENSIEEFAVNVLNYYEDFDISSETYIWLDSNGHGTNGAPHDMKDVYEDMETCVEYIYELYEILMSIIED